MHLILIEAFRVIITQFTFKTTKNMSKSFEFSENRNEFFSSSQKKVFFSKKTQKNGTKKVEIPPFLAESRVKSFTAAKCSHRTSRCCVEKELKIKAAFIFIRVCLHLSFFAFFCVHIPSLSPCYCGCCCCVHGWHGKMFANEQQTMFIYVLACILIKLFIQWCSPIDNLLHIHYQLVVSNTSAASTAAPIHCGCTIGKTYSCCCAYWGTPSIFNDEIQSFVQHHEAIFFFGENCIFV